MNWPLFIFDFVVFLPFTMIRLILIYMFGSKYNIKNCKFLDVLIHAENPYFNQTGEQTIDTIVEDIRAVVKNDTTFDNVCHTEVGIKCDTTGHDLFIKINDEINQKNKIFKTYTDAITEIDTDAVNSEYFNSIVDGYSSDFVTKRTLNVSTEMVDNVVLNALKQLEFDTFNTDDTDDTNDSDAANNVDVVDTVADDTVKLVEISFIDTSTDEEKENVLVEINTDYALNDD